jgi:hypothetical protein
MFSAYKQQECSSPSTYIHWLSWANWTWFFDDNLHIILETAGSVLSSKTKTMCTSTFSFHAKTAILSNDIQNNNINISVIQPTHCRD